MMNELDSTLRFKNLCLQAVRLRGIYVFPHRFRSKLEESMEKLGAGCYATVFLCPWDKTKAIKVSCKTEDGWLAYAALCIKYANLNNPLLPKIHNLRVYENFYIAVLDKYTGDLEDVLDSKPLYRRMRSVMRIVKGGVIEGEDAKYNFYATQLKELLAKEGLSAGDLHENNIMYRRNRIIVTDPIAGTYPDSRSKLKTLGIKVAA